LAKDIGFEAIFGVRHNDFLEIGRQMEMCNNGLAGEGEISGFCLDVGRIIGNFHFSIVTTENLVVSISGLGWKKFLSFLGIGTL